VVIHHPWRSEGRPSRRGVGFHWERVAERELNSNGLRTIERNYACRYGEVDLIMADAEELVFVEVRFRSHPHFGSGADSVTPHKQRKIIRTAQYYLAKARVSPRTTCRIDVVSIGGRPDDPQIEWIQNAFGLSD